MPSLDSGCPGAKRSQGKFVPWEIQALRGRRALDPLTLHPQRCNGESWSCCTCCERLQERPACTREQVWLCPVPQGSCYLGVMPAMCGGREVGTGVQGRGMQECGVSYVNGELSRNVHSGVCLERSTPVSLPPWACAPKRDAVYQCECASVPVHTAQISLVIVCTQKHA